MPCVVPGVAHFPVKGAFRDLHHQYYIAAVNINDRTHTHAH